MTSREDPFNALYKIYYYKIFKEYFQHTTWKKKQLSLTNVSQISEDILIVC